MKMMGALFASFVALTLFLAVTGESVPAPDAVVREPRAASDDFRGASSWQNYGSADSVSDEDDMYPTSDEGSYGYDPNRMRTCTMCCTRYGEMTPTNRRKQQRQGQIPEQCKNCLCSDPNVTIIFRQKNKSQRNKNRKRGNFF